MRKRSCLPPSRPSLSNRGFRESNQFPRTDDNTGDTADFHPAADLSFTDSAILATASSLITTEVRPWDPDTRWTAAAVTAGTATLAAASPIVITTEVNKRVATATVSSSIITTEKRKRKAQAVRDCRKRKNDQKKVTAARIEELRKDNMETEIRIKIYRALVEQMEMLMEAHLKAQPGCDMLQGGSNVT